MSTYHTHGSAAPRCAHRVHLVAKNVSAVIVQSHLHGEWANGQKLTPRQYAMIEFCQNPSCERVFHAEKQA